MTLPEWFPDGIPEPPKRLPGRVVHGGLTAVTRYGCRCGPCLRVRAEAEAMVARRVAGESMEAIGRDHGVTRERIRQITEAIAPWRPWDAPQIERREIKAEIAAVARETYVSCETCGEEAIGVTGDRRQIFCDAECRHIARIILRYACIDEADVQRQREASARWVLENLDTIDDPAERAIKRRYAERVLSGEAEHGRGRWFTDGSEAHRAARRAYREGWPIFERMHPDLRAQIIEEEETE